jgi:hypothetical protein
VTVDWESFLKCPVCGAAIGSPCVSLSGVTGRVVATDVPRDRPHSRRKLRAGYGR